MQPSYMRCICDVTGKCELYLRRNPNLGTELLVVGGTAERPPSLVSLHSHYLLARGGEVPGICLRAPLARK